MQMLTSLNPRKQTKPLFEDRLGEIQTNFASAMIGKTVSWMADAGTIAHGLVAGVLVETGTPKIVVIGRRYNLDRILTVCPVQFHPNN